MKFTLKEFVSLVEKFKNKNYEDSSKSDDAYKLAVKTRKLANNEIALKEEYFEDKRDYYFLKSLLDRNYKNNYIFYQDNTVKFDFDLFEPFIDKDNYSQKWHVLVSLLAYLDFVNHDDKCKPFRVKGDIESIELNNNEFTIYGENSKFTYTSMFVNWINKSLKEYSKSKTQIIKKNISGSDKKYLLKLNRKKTLEVYEKAQDSSIKKFYSLRDDFDIDGYALYEKVKQMPCICGGDESPTPHGIFNVEKKSSDCYISKYHKQYDEVKFFGYLVIFEDYFIHSNMYLMDTNEEMARNGNSKSISVDDEFTQGCIRVKQEHIDWLVENIEEGSIVIL